MRRRIQDVAGRLSVVVMSGAALFSVGMSGCASEPSKPAATVTPEQVRGHADTTFEKLKQEEQGRSSGSTLPR